jgi:hypothetical protein
MAPRVAFRGDSIMVWDGTLFRGRTFGNRQAKKYHAHKMIVSNYLWESVSYCKKVSRRHNFDDCK